MAYDKRRVSGAVGATGNLTFNLASDFAEIIGFRAVAVGDAAAKIGLTDGAGRVIYLDAADKDYTTLKDTLIAHDVTATGLATLPVDSTGAAQTIALGQGLTAQSPITVNWTNGTAGDTLTFDLYYRYPLWKQTHTLTVPDPAATITQSANLRSKYAQLRGIRALSVGTDVLMKLRVTDADSRIIYLDAADRDYDTAAVDLFLGYDDTLTGLTPQHLDATGAAATATSAAPLPIVRSPLELAVVNGGTAGDVITFTITYSSS